MLVLLNKNKSYPLLSKMLARKFYAISYVCKVDRIIKEFPKNAQGLHHGAQSPDLDKKYIFFL